MFKRYDTAEITPRDYAVQYATDLTDIEEYLKHIITVVNHPVLQMIKTLLLLKFQLRKEPSIYSYLNSATFPK
jgi:hypothetical protein